MWHENTGLPTNNPKYAESLAIMRVICGGEEQLDVQQGMIQALVSLIAEDGLYYVPAAGRAWHETSGHAVEVVTNKDFANVYGNSRVLLAMMAWMQYDPDGPWREKAAGVAGALGRIAVCKEDYAYYPDNGVGEAFSYPKDGWLHTREPATEDTGSEGSMFMYHCGPIRALSRWYALTADEEVLETARRLVNFVMQERFWGHPDLPKDIYGPQRGYFTGHMHGHIAMLYALIEYATVARDLRLMHFVRDGYDFARHHGITRLGAWLNAQPDVEACSISDIIAVAIKLTEAGMGDYYDDVDAAVRNQLAESQILHSDGLKQISESSPQSEMVDTPAWCYDQVLERTVGIVTCMQATGYDTPYMINCCTGNGTQAFYYAWSKIIEAHEDQTVQINLLLNRASPWMDIDSHLPYEGKVILHNKTASTAHVRVPSWVDRRELIVSVAGALREPRWLNNYLLVGDLNPDEDIEISFPVPEETVTYRIRYRETERDCICHFKGSTAIEVTTPDHTPAYRIYQREHYKQHRAPMRTTRRHIPRALIRW